MLTENVQRESLLFQTWEESKNIVLQYPVSVLNLYSATTLTTALIYVYSRGLTPDLWEWGPEFAAHIATATIAALPASRISSGCAIGINAAKVLNIVQHSWYGSNFPPLYNACDSLVHLYNCYYFLKI